jgi:hypothetical protein
MNLLLVPGYQSLFGPPEKTYEEYVSNIPSKMLITIAITLNSELNAPGEEGYNQKRIFEILGKYFDHDQLLKVVGGYRLFSAKYKSIYQGDIFGRRYLIALILKELARNKITDPDDHPENVEFNFFMAYLMTIDEVNDSDPKFTKHAVEDNGEDLFAYKLIWTPMIHQYQYNEHTDFPYELFKTACLLKYALQHLRPYLQEFINKYGFATIGEYLFSFYQVAMATVQTSDTSEFSKLIFINPKDNVDEGHLESQTINALAGQGNLSLPDIKKKPLYKEDTGKYMIIDFDIYLKKSYKGTYFDLRSLTSLANTYSYDKYSSTVATNVLEKMVFKSILETMRSSKHQVFHFDDKSDSVPDAYIRHNQTVFLIEFKGYLFPDEIPEKPSFESVKNYIDQRFIVNQQGHAKGISQLVNQIRLLKERKLTFDKKYFPDLQAKRITVYPIICADEFYFTIPGMNEYLNDRFRQEVEGLEDKRVTIKNVTIINLNRLLHLHLHDKTILDLQNSINQYWNIIKTRKSRLEKEISPDSFLRARSSFDEIYDQIILPKFAPMNGNRDQMTQLLTSLGITQANLDEIV